MGYQLNYFAAAYPAGNFDFANVTGPIFVKLDSTSRCVPATASTDKIEGILENAPPIANVCSVSYLGTTKVTVDAAYTVGTLLTATANGLATQCTSDSSLARAMVIEASDASNNIVTVRLIDQPGVTY